MRCDYDSRAYVMNKKELNAKQRRRLDIATQQPTEIWKEERGASKRLEKRKEAERVNLQYWEEEGARI